MDTTCEPKTKLMAFRVPVDQTAYLRRMAREKSCSMTEIVIGDMIPAYMRQHPVHQPSTVEVANE
jgi:hypothetical protein